jgi:hypothetical protein
MVVYANTVGSESEITPLTGFCRRRIAATADVYDPRKRWGARPTETVEFWGEGVA